MSVKFTTKDFIKRAKEIHGDEYDYSKVEYINAKTKVRIICPTHGEFEQTPDKHLQGKKCRKCAMSHINDKNKISTENFIKKSKEKYGDKFSYDKCNVISMSKKTIITCKLHGDFEITPSSHLRKNGGCPFCLKEQNHLIYAKTTEKFITDAKKVHGDKYDYSKVKYINNKTKVCIICLEHGEFWMSPDKHLQGRGCIKCALKNKHYKLSYTTKDFIERAREVHGDKYDYSKVEYVDYDTKVCIICPKHGEFEQTPDSHLQGSGCQKCSRKISHNETEIYTLLKNVIDVDNIIILKNKELDIFVPSKNIAIEYNGLRWHSELFKINKNYHLNKTLECNKQGIKLLQIFEDEYIEHKDIVLNKIKHILGIQENLSKIMGRKCEIEVIDNKTAEAFLNDYHIQGFAPSTVYLGAVYDNNLIGVMTFKQNFKGSDKWELTRFASDYHYICQGVGSKLFNYFIKNYSPSEVKSFADRRWTLDKENNLYTKLGFSLDKILKPDYRYISNSTYKGRIHKFNFRKEVLHKKYGFPLTMTETEMVKKLGYSKIWDCGLFKFVWKKIVN